MLATAEQVKKAMELSVEEVRTALKNIGYGDDVNEISDVRFKGFNGTQFVYEITYPSSEHECSETGNIYISLKRRAFSADYVFYAEY